MVGVCSAQTDSGLDKRFFFSLSSQFVCHFIDRVGLRRPQKDKKPKKPESVPAAKVRSDGNNAMVATNYLIDCGVWRESLLL